MLRILFIALSSIVFFSCENIETSNENIEVEVIDEKTDLERNIQGNWVDKQDSTINWEFNDSLVKWKGFTQKLDYSETYFEVGSIRYNVKEKEKGFVLINQTTKEKHELVKDNV